MAGASEQTQRVAYINGNWTAGKEAAEGPFELQVITEDGTKHGLRVAAQDMMTVVAMVRASSVLLWDPEAETLIAANLAGEWIQSSWSAGDTRRAGRPHPAQD